jgi:hypothetical protein
MNSETNIIYRRGRELGLEARPLLALAGGQRPGNHHNQNQTKKPLTRFSLQNRLAERAIEAKRLTFTCSAPANELVAFVRDLSSKLSADAPAYLRPSAQLKLLHTAMDCLAVLELAVNWEAEKLYGVEGLGPFDEF